MIQNNALQITLGKIGIISTGIKKHRNNKIDTMENRRNEWE